MQRWITFQLLHALSQAHAHGVCHGDIKCENVMVTSWNWLLLVDFASYKPTYLPADNPVSILVAIPVTTKESKCSFVVIIDVIST